MKLSVARLIAITPLFFTGISRAGDPGALIFQDDFNYGLAQWELRQPEHITIIDEPGANNRVMELKPKDDHFVHALMRGTQKASHVRLEGDMLFPTDGDGYLGLIYNYQKHHGRADFGVIYIKSNGSYIRVSPHYDDNPSWRLHEELKVKLEGKRQIQPMRWYRFRLDIAGTTASLYLDDFDQPLVSYSLFEQESGQLGLEARPGFGEPVWVDNVSVSPLPMDNSAPAGESIDYETSNLISQWKVSGPYSMSEAGREESLPKNPEQVSWQTFEPDIRGMVRTGRITEYLGDRHVAWFRHDFNFNPAIDRPFSLQLSSANPISVWLNGQWLADVPAEDYAWFDFLSVDEHAGSTLLLAPLAGSNTLLLRVDGKRFAAGGFYAALITTTSP